MVRCYVIPDQVLNWTQGETIVQSVNGVLESKKKKSNLFLLLPTTLFINLLFSSSQSTQVCVMSLILISTGFWGGVQQLKIRTNQNKNSSNYLRLKCRTIGTCKEALRPSYIFSFEGGTNISYFPACVRISFLYYVSYLKLGDILPLPRQIYFIKPTIPTSHNTVIHDSLLPSLIGTPL